MEGNTEENIIEHQRDDVLEYLQNIEELTEL